MTQTNDHDFQQFRGQFDDAMIPDVSFKAKMEKLLQSEKPVEPERKSTVLASPPKKQSETIAPRRSHPLMVAVAILMVFSVVIASVWVLSGDVLEGEYASAPSGIPTMPADAPGMPGDDVHLTAERFPNWLQEDNLIGIYDGILLSSRWIEDPEPIVTLVEPYSSDRPAPISTSIFTARNASTEDILWEIEAADLNIVDVNDGRIIAWEWYWDEAESGSSPPRHLTVIDLKTGARIWNQDVSNEITLDLWTRHTPPVVVNEHIIVATSHGDVFSWNIDTGKPGWESNFEAGTGWVNRIGAEDGSDQEVTVREIASTEWNEQFVIMNGDGLMTLIAPATGDILAEHQVASTPGDIAMINSLQLHSSDSHILMMREILDDGPQGQIVAFAPASGEQLWERQIGGQLQASPDDGTVAINSHVWKSSNWLMQLLRNYGYSTFQFHWIDGSTGEDILSTDRGKLEAAPVTLTDGNYACTRTERAEIICFDRSGTRHILDIEPFGDPVLIDGVLYLPTGDGLFRVELP